MLSSRLAEALGGAWLEAYWVFVSLVLDTVFCVVPLGSKSTAWHGLPSCKMGSFWAMYIYCQRGRAGCWMSPTPLGVHAVSRSGTGVIQNIRWIYNSHISVTASNPAGILLRTRLLQVPFVRSRTRSSCSNDATILWFHRNWSYRHTKRTERVAACEQLWTWNSERQEAGKDRGPFLCFQNPTCPVQLLGPELTSRHFLQPTIELSCHKTNLPLSSRECTVLLHLFLVSLIAFRRPCFLRI